MSNTKLLFARSRKGFYKQSVLGRWFQTIFNNVLMLLYLRGLTGVSVEIHLIVRSECEFFVDFKDKRYA